MASNPKKSRSSISIEKKRKILSEYDKRSKAGKVHLQKLADFFGIPHSTLRSIISNRETIEDKDTAGNRFRGTKVM